MYYLTNDQKDLYLGSIKAENVSKIPVGVWDVKVDPVSKEYYLSKSENFVLPKKLYGNPQSFADKVLKRYFSRDKNLGVLLNGLKGTGKSVTAKIICNSSNLPVICINEPHKGTVFNSFITSIKDKAVIFVDEFEKVYTREDQQHLLTLLDGVYEGNKLYLLTSNQRNLHDALNNRPGRIYYSKEYVSLSDDVIEEIIEDLLDNKDHKEGLITLLSVLGDVNMDSLTTIIDEMNFFKKDSREIIDDLNISPSQSSRYSYEVGFPRAFYHGDRTFGGTLEGYTSNPFSGFNLEGYIKGTSNVDHSKFYDILGDNFEEDEDTPPKDKIGELLSPENVYSSNHSHYMDESFSLEDEDYKIEILGKGKYKITILEKGSYYEGLEVIVTKQEPKVYTYSY